MTATKPRIPGQDCATESPVEVMTEDARWSSVLDLPALASRAACATLSDQGVDPESVEIALLACDDARIATLNAGFRGKAQPTNVLSWPSWDLTAQSDGDHPDPPATGTPGARESLGDIALALDTCTTEAQAQGKRLDAHVTHLIVHAVLHLLGYDHERDRDAALMENTEVRILAQLGLPDPYEPADQTSG